MEDMKILSKILKEVRVDLLDKKMDIYEIASIIYTTEKFYEEDDFIHSYEVLQNESVSFKLIDEYNPYDNVDYWINIEFEIIEKNEESPHLSKVKIIDISWI